MYVFRYEFKGGGSVSVVVCCEQIRYRVIDARLIYFVLETDKARILLTDRFFFFGIYAISLRVTLWWLFVL